MSKQTMISTKDNPYDYFNDFTSWYMFDMDHGYDTCGYLARIAKTSDSMSTKEYYDEIERAVDEIIKYDFRDLYIKVIK